ncbi:MAG: CCA tRNA nucleotidyltransferase [Nitrospirae bacterium]|nr:CCA tRNA nucleotidyltransferase [Nitrospirota bacterium]
MNIEKIILSDPINKWIFSYVKKDIFLVGGYIRDLLYRGFINKDRDFILKADIKKIALKTSKKFTGTFIELKKNKTCRVALQDGVFLDFSYIRNGLADDLSKRDFTINAIAWSPEQGIIDLYNGLSDLNQKIIKVVNHNNLLEDPLRVLRAYRIAAQLGLNFSEGTRNYLRKYSGGLKYVSLKRITEELFKLLCTENAAFYLYLSMEDNVLGKILGSSKQELKENLILLNQFDNYLLKLRKNDINKRLNIRLLKILQQNIGQGLSRDGLIRLSILLLNLYGTSGYGGNLIYSNTIKKKLIKIHYGMRLAGGRINCNRLYNIFNAANDCEFEIALILSVIRSRNVNKYLKRADDFKKFKRNKLLNGNEIQDILTSGPSEIIGKIQTDLHKRRFLGIIRSKKDAVHWIISNLT